MAESPSDDLSIAVIVPVRNMARTVRDLLDSLMKLDYDEDKLEIVFVDGNSTDGTREIIGESRRSLTVLAMFLTGTITAMEGSSEESAILSAFDSRISLLIKRFTL